MSDYLQGADESVLRGMLGGTVEIPLNIHSIAYENARVIKTGPGILYGISVYSSLAAAQWIQFFDATTVPADGAIPECIYTVAATANLTLNWIPGRPFKSGIVVVNSTTGPTKTIGAANCFFDAQYL